MTPRLPLILTLGAVALAPQLRGPQAVRITGTDYAFQVPQHIHAGETIFTFENRGSVRHEMSLALLKPGVDADSVFAGVLAGTPKRNFVDGQAALIVSRPGETPGPGIFMNLEAGRTYLVVCTLKDSPDAQPHVMLGMASRFVVEP